jgi:sugar-specific transcriptional regulator TrmB
MERSSMIENKHIQTLMNFGLSFLQAKTYLNLVQLGKADVKTIAKASNVARQDIYRIMPTLQKMGLGEKIIAKPTMYRAAPLKEGLSILLQKRKEEYAELQKKKSSLLNNFHVRNTKMAFQEESTQFIITSEITRLLKMLKKLIQKAQESIDVIMPLIFTPSKLTEGLLYLKEAITSKSDVKIRLITQEPEEQAISRKLQALVKNHFFELKYLTSPFCFGMHIFDKKEVTLSISENSGLPSLWSSNPNVVMLSQAYFDTLWEKAAKAGT